MKALPPALQAHLDGDCAEIKGNSLFSQSSRKDALSFISSFKTRLSAMANDGFRLLEDADTQAHHVFFHAAASLQIALKKFIHAGGMLGFEDALLLEQGFYSQPAPEEKRTHF